MNNMRKNMVKILLSIIIICCCVILCILNSITHKGIILENWNDYYNENNIVFFYEDFSNEKIKVLEDMFDLKKISEDTMEELDKALEIVKICNKIVEYDDVNNYDGNSAYDILKEKGENKKVSNHDLAVITRDMLNAVNIKSRIGVFRSGDAQFKERYEYYIVEFWSVKYSKWIALDCIDAGYFMHGNTKLSAIEILNNKFRDVSYLGNSTQKNYKNKLNAFLDSYSIDIDNTIASGRSNSCVTYVKDEKALQIKYNNIFAKPTIFTTENILFEKSPYDRRVGSDEKSYIILSLNNKQDKESDEAITELIIAGFKDGKVMDDFYLNINGGGYEEVKRYKVVQLEKGIMKIELSCDGQNVCSSLNIDKQK